MRFPGWLAKAATLLTVLVAILAISSGCSGKREVTGQVFVVTKGGENVKLGLVNIHLVGEKQLSNVAAKLLGESQQGVLGEVLLLELESELKALMPTVSVSQPGLLDKIIAEASWRRGGIPRFPEESLGRRLFGEIPSAVAQTDADGMFTVEASSSDWLAARAERRTGSTTESYLWLLPLRNVSKKLLISNDRLVEDEENLARILASVSAAENLSTMVDKDLVIWVERQRIVAKQAATEAMAANGRALAEAKTKAGAGDQLAAKSKADEESAKAEAKAKAEADESQIASKLGMRRPLETGARGQAGGVPVRWISRGRYQMGTPWEEKGLSSEVQHEVILSRGFFLAETECTQAQWEAVMGSNPSNFSGADRPVERVSWYDAMEFCRNLTTKQRDEGILPEGWEWRLPTEAEWEFATRAETVGTRHGELEAIAWWSGNSGRQTQPVKQKAPNDWGLYDMLGNVWEWCADWNGAYPTGSITDPLGPESGASRVIRGGSWRDDSNNVRSAYRFERDPSGSNLNLGFRPALSSVR